MPPRFLFLSLLLLITNFCWATGVITLEEWRAKSTCEPGLVTSGAQKPHIVTATEFPWVAQISKENKTIYADFEKMGEIAGDAFGLLAVSTKGRVFLYYYVQFDSNGSLQENFEVGRGIGGLAEADWRRLENHAKQLVRNFVTQQFAHLIKGSKGESVLDMSEDLEPRVARRRFALSENARWLAVYKQGSVEVHSLTNRRAPLAMAFNPGGTTSYLDSVSPDGSLVNLRVHDFKTGKAETVVLNLKSQREEFRTEDDILGHPYIKFYRAGMTVLTRDQLKVYWAGKLTHAYPVARMTGVEALGLEFMNMPRQAYFNPEVKELVLFSQGPPPIRIKGNRRKSFDDFRIRAATAKSPQDELLASYMADKYTALNDGHFTVSRDWRFVAQHRQSGLTLDHSLSNTVELFQMNGRHVRTYAPFWSVGPIALSADGRYLAIAERSEKPKAGENLKERIWIYSTDSADVPVYAIEDIELWSIDRLVFSEDTRYLYVESVNSGKILKYSLKE